MSTRWAPDRHRTLMREVRNSDTMLWSVTVEQRGNEPVQCRVYVDDDLEAPATMTAAELDVLATVLRAAAALLRDTPSAPPSGSSP
jgi:hypothetical protein